MPDKELAALCALNSLYVNKCRCEALMRVHSTLSDAWDELAGGKLSLDNPAQFKERLSPALLDRAGYAEIELAEKEGIHLLPFWDPRYPSLLSSIVNPPPLLYIRGDMAALDGQNIALVGSRTHSSYGRKVATGLTAALVDLGYTIVSGLARGIDRECHLSALDNGGKTVAVIGSGLLNIYPASNSDLAKAIVTNGAVVSEFPLKATPMRFHFPRRNRVISGLSLATVVIEAGVKSGALITAQWAAEQGREVFAVPGPIDTGLSGGCHELLRDGARLVESTQDIETELHGLKTLFMQSKEGKLFSAPPPPQPTRSFAAINPEEARKKLLLETLGFRGMDINGIEEQTGLGPEITLPILLNLELAGSIVRKSGGVFAKKS